MDITYLIVILFLMTLSAVLVFALVSKWKIEKRLENDDAPKSSLAADGPSGK